VALAVSALVMLAAPSQIVITSVAVVVLHGWPLLTVMVTLVIPAAVGVPKIRFRLEPVPRDKPGGSGAAV
jgi:hypothetical protein